MGKKRSPWDGYDPHPVIDAVTAEVAQHGFAFARGGRFFAAEIGAEVQPDAARARYASGIA